MPKQIKAIRPRRRKYDWSEWTNGKAWRARKGKDFNVDILNFCSAIYGHARRYDMDVTIYRHNLRGVDTVDFQFLLGPLDRRQSRKKTKARIGSKKSKSKIIRKKPKTRKG